jgi:F-type H+-transporting ATPase subunit a
MGHNTFLDLIPQYRHLQAFAEGWLGRGWKWQMFQENAFSLSHVAGALLVFVFLVYAGLRFRRASLAAVGGGGEGLLPPRSFGLRNFLELFLDTVVGLMEGAMGAKNARRFLPLIGTLAFFIFFSNVMGLIPGFPAPTTTLKTNLALAGTVFLLTHAYGVREHGLKYFKHFFGPIVAWYALPLMLLMFVIELISHIARPVSLSLRLMGNMAADHKVVAAFFALVPLVVPVPFLILGLLVATVQTLVFCLLSMVYISMAVAHEEH